MAKVAPEPSSSSSWTLTKGELSDLAAKHSEGGADILASKYGGVQGLAKLLQTNVATGLSSLDAADLAARTRVFDSNFVERAPLPTYLALCFVALEDPLLIVLLVAAAVSLVLDMSTSNHPETAWVESFAIALSVFVVVNVTAATDWKSARDAEALNSCADNVLIRVKRDGKFSMGPQDEAGSAEAVYKADVVVGDLIQLKVGDIICADGVIIECSDLQISEAALTGETDLVKKDPVAKPFMLAGTDVANGAGVMVVIAVGLNSAAGKIQAAADGKTITRDAIEGAWEAGPGEGELTIVCEEEDAEITDSSCTKKVVSRPVNLKSLLKRTFTFSCENISCGKCSCAIKPKCGFENAKVSLGKEEFEVINVAKSGSEGAWVVSLDHPFQQLPQLRKQCEEYAAKGLDTPKLYKVIEEEAEETTVLFEKLDAMAVQIGYFATGAALLCVIVMFVKWIFSAFILPEGWITPKPASGSDTDHPSGVAWGRRRIFFTTPWCDDPCNIFRFSKEGCLDWQLTAASCGTDCCENFARDAYESLATNGTSGHYAIGSMNYTYGAYKGNGWCKEDPGKFLHYLHDSDLDLLLKMFITGITILVVAIPEGLPLAVTLALFFSSSKMRKALPAKEEGTADEARRYLFANCLVKQLQACETMGSATAICSDKTGTLTTNRMVVAKTFVAGFDLGADIDLGGEAPKSASDGAGAFPSIDSLSGNPADILKEVLTGGAARTEISDTVLETVKLSLALNSSDDTEVEMVEGALGKHLLYKGNKTECAFIRFAQDLFGAGDVQALRGKAESANAALNNPFSYPNCERLFPFSSKNKMMSILVRHPTAAGTWRLYVKGASERVLSRCTTTLAANGSATPFPDADRTTVQDGVISKYAGQALRTLCFAYRDLDDATLTKLAAASRDEAAALASKAAAERSFMDDAPGAEAPHGTTDERWSGLEQHVVATELTMVCIMGVRDPVRAEVPPAIARASRAGIVTRMCTGDNLATAAAIGVQCNLITSGYTIETKGETETTVRPVSNAQVLYTTDDHGTRTIVGMTGPYFREQVRDAETGKLLDDGVPFDAIWPNLRILARCSPDDKLLLVSNMRKSSLHEKFAPKHMQALRPIGVHLDQEVVAVTGDGTNDAPALKAADVGFAMGKEGTEIAKQAANIILQDDNFTAIVKSCMWGRNVYDSIQKFLQFQLTVNVVAVTIAVVGAMHLGESPLTAVQLLWVNLIMDSFASLALATEPPTLALLERLPYGRNKSLLSPEMIRFIVFSAIYQLVVLIAVIYWGELFLIECAWGKGYTPLPNGCQQPGQWDIVPKGTAEVGRERPSSLSPTRHYTCVFVIFVFMQIFNEINARKLKNECFACAGMHKNPWFISIVLMTLIVQIMMVEIPFVNSLFSCVGLDPVQWIICIAFGAGSLLVGMLQRCFPVDLRCGKACNRAGKSLENQDNAVVVVPKIGGRGNIHRSISKA